MKKIVAGVLALCICGGLAAPVGRYSLAGTSITACAEDAKEFTEGTYESLTYEKYSDHVEITKCDKDAEGEFVIPDTIEKLPVTVIKTYAFSYCNNLTSITIPDSVTNINDFAIFKCFGLTSINVSEKNTKYSSSDGVLFNKDKTVIVSYPSGKEETEYIIPDGVTKIGDNAFMHSSLTLVTIPDGVETIGKNAFVYCSGLTSITLPDSVKSIGMIAFGSCENLTSVNIPYGVTSIESYTFLKCSNLESIKIPDSVTSIGERAFENSGLTSITLPNSVTIIEKNAFNCCENLTSINIPDGVTKISDAAFATCISLTSVNIPDAVTYIGDHAFLGCKSLTSIAISDNVTYIGDLAFLGCRTLTSINISKDNKEYCSLDGVLFNKGETTLIAYPCGKKDPNYTIPDSVSEIKKGAFNNCSNLSSLTIETPDCIIFGGNYTISNGYDEERDRYYFNGTIYSYEGSTAQEYAEYCGYKFEPIEDAPAIVSPTEKIFYGDANCDDKVSIADSTAILQHLGNEDKYGLSDKGKLNADVDGVKGVTGNDAIMIQMVDAKLISVDELGAKKD